MLTHDQFSQAVESLRVQLLLSREEEEKFFRQAIDVQHWKHLAKGLSICGLGAATPVEQEPISAQSEKAALTHLTRHGYFRLPPLVEPAVTARMLGTIEALHKAGWPPVFAFVYDDFWATVRTPSLARVLSARLGAGYRQSSAIWAHRVDPQRRAGGWAPHVDSGKGIERLSLWIPLADATIDNGCIYIIPADRVPASLPANYLEWTSISVGELQQLLHAVTPLPASRGSVLGWNHALVHWGGQTTGGHLRISIAVEFLAEAANPLPAELPMFDSDLPDFTARLRAIGQAIRAYEKFEPLMGRYLGLAARLSAWAG